MSEEQLPFAPACERNKQPILEVLRRVLPQSGTVLEIGSCTGQHLVFFANELPGLEWQPSDQAEYLPGLNLRLEQEAGSNVHPAIVLDVASDWPTSRFDAVISANTAHIMDWPEVVCMFDGVSRVLLPGGVFALYGPFNENGEFTSASNQAFDQDLKSRDPRMGIRDRKDLETLATNHQMSLEQKVAMPANNQVLVFRRV
jgi:SAM-dependent methyltransferase